MTNPLFQTTLDQLGATAEDWERRKERARENAASPLLLKSPGPADPAKRRARKAQRAARRKNR